MYAIASPASFHARQTYRPASYTCPRRICNFKPLVDSCNLLLLITTILFIAVLVIAAIATLLGYYDLPLVLFLLITATLLLLITAALFCDN